MLQNYWDVGLMAIIAVSAIFMVVGLKKVPKSRLGEISGYIMVINIIAFLIFAHFEGAKI